MPRAFKALDRTLSGLLEGGIELAVVCTALAEAFEWTALRKGSTALLVVLIFLRWSMKDHLSDAERKRRLNLLFKRYPPPLVEEADLYTMFGVTPSPLADTDSPYVARDLDDQLDRALRNERLVLVIVSGPSKAGKSRTAAEGVRRVYPRCKLWVPANPGTRDGLLPVTELANGDLPRESDSTGAVLWLDDAERFL